MEDDILVKTMRMRLAEYRTAAADAERMAARSTANAEMREGWEKIARSYHDLAARITESWNLDD